MLGVILIMPVDNNTALNITLKKTRMEELTHTAYSTATDILHNKIVCISVVGM